MKCLGVAEDERLKKLVEYQIACYDYNVRHHRNTPRDYHHFQILLDWKPKEPSGCDTTQPLTVSVSIIAAEMGDAWTCHQTAGSDCVTSSIFHQTRKASHFGSNRHQSS
jgi:hypothetical protein